MNGFLLGRVRGIDIRVNWSVLIIGGLVAASLANEILPDIAEGYSTGEYWLAGITATIAFFAGLLAHELSHSVVALAEGVRVSSITLWLFGGVAQLEAPPSTPRAAMKIAAAGPLMSAAIGVIAMLAATVFSGLLGATLVWFGVINLLLAVFNLLPAYPMDGGRMYHARLWSQTGDQAQATERAARLGLTLGGGLVGLGLLQVVLGGFIGGLWLALIGLFVREAARAELRQTQMEGPLRHVLIADVMTPNPETVDATSSVASFVDSYLRESRHAAYPVIDQNGNAIGLITLRSVRDLPAEAWPATSVGAAATPLADIDVVPSATPLSSLLPNMGLGGRRVLVSDDGELVGIVSPSDIARWVSVLEVVGRTGHESSD